MPPWRESSIDRKIIAIGPGGACISREGIREKNGAVKTNDIPARMNAKDDDGHPPYRQRRRLTTSAGRAKLKLRTIAQRQKKEENLQVLENLKTPFKNVYSRSLYNRTIN
jgi:hypothetical protein